VNASVILYTDLLLFRMSPVHGDVGYTTDADVLYM